MEPTVLTADSPGRPTTHVVHALMHFVRVVRYRQSIVLTSITVGLLLGGLYFATAKRFYQSKASLLVLQTGMDLSNPAMTPDSMRQGLMPTYERLFSSAVVLEGALKLLTPPERIDFQAVPPETWTTQLRNNLSATTVRQTNIIEIAYRSSTPKTAVAVVHALLQSYLDFMDKTHKGTAGEIIKVLTQEKGQLEQKLVQKEAEVLAARKKFGDLGIRSGTNLVHPMVQRALGLNEALIKVQQKRLELQAALAAVQSAVRNGEDLHQHMLSLENSVGREFLLSGLGFNTRDANVQATLEKSLLEDQAQLKTMEAYLGPNHPEYQQIADRMRVTQSYLANYQARMDHRLSELRQHQLGPMLVQMIQQRLSETWQHENSLRGSFEKARTEAVNMNGDLAQLEILEHDLKWLRELRDVLLNQIAGIDLKQEHGDIRTAVVGEPQLPKNPVWPKLPLVGLCALLCGLGGGLVIVYVLDILDDRFRSPEELRSQLGVPVLAMVRQMEELNAVGIEAIQVHVAPEAVESEAFRTLRTTLAFSSQESARIVVSSAEPGDGKTTVLANLAASFAQSGKRTLLIDADMRRPGLSNMMGMKGQSGLSDILVSEEPVSELAPTMVRSLSAQGLDFLPAGPRRPNPAELLGTSRLADLLAWAESTYDQILVDSPPALAATDAQIIGRLVDGLVLVVHPKKNQRRLVVRAAESFTNVGIQLFGVVVNRIGNDKSDTLYGYGAGYGYGYGYGYAEGYLRDADEASESGDAAPATIAVPERNSEVSLARERVVPRRVA